MKKKSKNGVSRRDFVEQAGKAGAVVAAGLVAGCKTPEAAQSAVKETTGPSFLSKVVTAKIHPGIGVARIGNSTEGFYIGPEVTKPALTEHGSLRDATGALKKQAARFRIYGYDSQGNVLGEITAAMAEVEWHVHLANKKAQWYRFLAALDIPEAESMKCKRRNGTFAGAARKNLAIDPGPRKISGASQAGAAHRFDGAKFLEQPVSLGELRTDEAGRLLVFPGRGHSGSPQEAIIFDPADEETFNNADAWFDDIADGPVSAKLKIGGEDIAVDSAWVFVGPPNYAPDVVSWRTLYDLLSDTYIEAGMLPFPEKTSFTKHILPILSRLSNLQWVNKGFQTGFGAGSVFNFDDTALLEKLATVPETLVNDPNFEARKKIFAFFRQGTAGATERKTWPWMYGDAFGSFENSPRLNLAVSEVRLKHLKRWLEGNFVGDYDKDFKPPQKVEDVPLAEQPAMLDQAALYFCLADAFHPGCEVTWPMRHASMYRAPWRIKQRPAEEAEPDYGDELTQAICLSNDGPLQAQGPGDLTKWMAIPWQGDTAFCRSGYEPDIDPFILTYWPARVPNHVLTETDYQVVMDETQPRQKRLDAFKKRRSWFRNLTGGAPNQMQQVIDGIHMLGVVEARPGVPNDPDLPPVMLVEGLAAGFSLTADDPDYVPKNKYEAAGWESKEQLDEFRRILGLKKKS